MGSPSEYASQIIAAGKARNEPQRNIQIALMVALAESGLRNYANKNVPESMSIPHDAVGSDHRSVGVFQQQVGIWGTAAELMNVATSANKFYDALDKKNISTMTDWMAAQSVQISAFSDGSNYRAKLPQAQALMQQLYGSASATNVELASSTGGGKSVLGIPNSVYSGAFWVRVGVGAVGVVLIIIAVIRILNSSGIDTPNIKDLTHARS